MSDVRESILAGLKAGVEEYVAGLFKVYCSANGRQDHDERLEAGLRKAVELYGVAIRIAEHVVEGGESEA